MTTQGDDDGEVREQTAAEVDIHRHLATYFLSQADPTGDLSWASQERRAVELLPYHLLKAHMWLKLKDVLCDLGLPAAVLLLVLSLQTFLCVVIAPWLLVYRF